MTWRNGGKSRTPPEAERGVRCLTDVPDRFLLVRYLQLLRWLLHALRVLLLGLGRVPRPSSPTLGSTLLVDLLGDIQAVLQNRIVPVIAEIVESFVVRGPYIGVQTI